MTSRAVLRSSNIESQPVMRRIVILVVLIGALSAKADVPLNSIESIQGNGPTSPLVGKDIVTIGIVTALKSNGFFIQERPGYADNDPATSEGIFVFTSSAPTVAVGDMVDVWGVVQEYVPSSDKASAPFTEIVSPRIEVVAKNQTLPPPVVLTASDTSNLERFEGMRVTVTLDVVGPEDGSINEATATSQPNGVFYGVIHGVRRPFREPGINVSDAVPAPNPPDVPRFDENFERIRVDSDTPGATPARQPLDVSVGQSVTTTGVVDFAYRVYSILPDPGASTISGMSLVRDASTPAFNEFTVATANLQRFFDDVDDPALSSEPVLTTSAFAFRLRKASIAIRDVLHFPDIIVLEEIENLGTLTSLANTINSDTVAAGQPDPKYAPHLIEGNDVGGIDIGMLTKSSMAGSSPRVEVVSVTQFNKSETYVDPTTGKPATLNDRPPLVLRAVVHFASGESFPVTIIGNHLRSLNDVETDARVRAKRAAQAESLAMLIQQLQSAGERVVVAGDFNAFEFNDGFVDVIGTIAGKPAPASQVVVPTRDLVDPDLLNLDDLLPAAERYSYVFDGNAEALDHILVSASLRAAVGGIRFDHARINADMSEALRFPLCTAACPFSLSRLSDHDPGIAYFALPSPSPLRRRAGGK